MGVSSGGESLTHSNPTQHAPVRVVTASGGHYSRRVVQSLGYELSARLAYTLTHITLQRIGATSGGLAKYHTPREAEGPATNARILLVMPKHLVVYPHER